MVKLVGCRPNLASSSQSKSVWRIRMKKIPNHPKSNKYQPFHSLSFVQIHSLHLSSLLLILINLLCLLSFEKNWARFARRVWHKYPRFTNVICHYGRSQSYVVFRRAYARRQTVTCFACGLFHFGRSQSYEVFRRPDCRR